MRGKKLLLGSVLGLVAMAASAQVNVNTATAEELESLNGVGEAKAQAIVEYREANGGFETAADLTKVSGIGAKTVDSIRDDISTGNPD